MAMSGLFEAWVPTLGLITFAELTRPAEGREVDPVRYEWCTSNVLSGELEMPHSSAGSILHKILVAAFTLLAAAHALADIDAECGSKWKSSTASGSCKLTYASQDQKGICTLRSSCTRASGIQEDNLQTTWPLAGVSRLRNENGRLAGGEVREAQADEN